MRQRIDNETEDFVRKTFGMAPKNTMKHQNGLDEIDLAAQREGYMKRRINFFRPRNKFNTVIS